MQGELRVDDTVGPQNARDIGFGPLPETEVFRGTGDGLRLEQQPGANLHHAAHPERIDTLIACRRDCPGANHLPVIILRAVIHGFDRTAIRIETQQVQATGVVHVGGCEDALGTSGLIEQCVAAILISQPNEHSAARLGEEEIDRAVVVQIRREQPETAVQRIGCVGYMRDLRRAPAVVVVNEAHNGSIAADDEQIEPAAVPGVRGGDGSYSPGKCRQSQFAKMTGAFVVNDVQLAGAVDESEIGNAIVVKIGPDKLLDAGN